MRIIFLLTMVVVSACAHTATPLPPDHVTVIAGALIIDGTGTAPVVANLILSGDRVAAITTDDPPADAHVIDAHGKVIMPMMIDVHAHLGLLEGMTTAADHYTRANIERQLVRYRDYGVQAVLSLGSDHAEIFGLRDASREGSLPGARIFTAGFGFGVVGGLPPVEMGFDHAYRPTSAEEARAQVRELATARPDVVKIWVDDSWGKYPKMQPDIYRAIIDEAHTHGLRVAAHVYHLDDARALVEAGVDILAHSVRDAPVDAAFAAAMRQHAVIYVPTLSIDEFAFTYVAPPEWMHDPFFTQACEPGVVDMLQSRAYVEKLWKNPVTRLESEAYKAALANLNTVFHAGVTVAMGTDSGANAVRVQGFSEHHELANMVAAGLTPLEAITVATRNGARLLHIDDHTGTLEVGKDASFVILRENPLTRIENTETIDAVYYRGQRFAAP